MLAVGLAREDITVFEPGMAMMGWGVPWCQAQGVGMPLHARAMVVDDGRDRFAYVVVELLVVTQGLWRGVLDVLARDHAELGLDARNVSLVATHTHSGPSGYGHHFWINLTTPGFSQVVYDSLVQGVVQAIVDAAADCAPATLTLHTAEVARGVAFNRSVPAYNRNVDVPSVRGDQTDEAVDRTMTVLDLRGADGTRRGVVCWFGLHGTCVHSDNAHLHPDHKGILANLLEADGGVALCAQGPCGDVSPNHRDSDRGHTVGPHDDDLESARLVAEAQAGAVRAALAEEGTPLDGPVVARTAVVDFANASADGRFVRNGRDQTTSPARLGISMAMGTAEGRGPLFPLGGLIRRVQQARGWVFGDPKWPLLDLGRGAESKVLGMVPLPWVPPVDPVVRWIRDHVRAGNPGEAPWVPQELPVHLLRIGSFGVLTAPFEATTTTGHRVCATLVDDAEGIEHAVMSPYANAYVGYLTTEEEYGEQHYEAGYTLFGPHTLAALRTAVSRLAKHADAPGLEGEAPPAEAEAVLASMPFVEPWPVPAGKRAIGG